MSLIGDNNIWAIWAIIAVSVAVSIFLESRYKWAAKMSALVIALLLGIVLSNCRIIPTQSAVYDCVWDYLVPLALPMLLFHVDIRKIWKESGQLLIAYMVGAAGTVVGAVVAFFIFRRVIPEIAGITAMMTGTYIGGSVNFMALSDVFNVSSELVSSATIADNLNMAIYFFVLLSIPVRSRAVSSSEDIIRHNKGEMSIKNVSVCLAIGFLIVALSSGLADISGNLIPLSNPGLEILANLLGNKYLWITTVSVVGATAFPDFFGSIAGGQEIGTYIIYCFMFVIGAPASIQGIIKNSPALLLLAVVVVGFNMAFTFVGGNILGIKRDVLIIASNANVGGPTTAASMAIAKGWEDLVGPALLIGSFGYVIGNYLGMVIGYFCQGL